MAIIDYQDVIIDPFFFSRSERRPDNIELPNGENCFNGTRDRHQSIDQSTTCRIGMSSPGPQLGWRVGRKSLSSEKGDSKRV